VTAYKAKRIAGKITGNTKVMRTWETVTSWGNWGPFQGSGAGSGYQWLDGRRTQRGCHGQVAQGWHISASVILYAHQYTNTFFSLSCRVPVDLGTAHSTIRLIILTNISIVKMVI